MMARTSRWLTPATLFFVCLWVALLWVGRERMLRDPGTLWHTVVGQQILSTGKLIHTDSFSFTEQGQPWIAQQWLGECAMAIVHRFAGIDGLVMLSVTILAGLFTFLAMRLVRGGMNWPIAVFVILLALAASSYHFIPRPHLATMLFLAAAYALLCDVEAGRLLPRWLLMLPPLFVVWTNIHGGALGGIVTLLMVMVGWLVRPIARHRVVGDPQQTASPLMIAVALCASVSAILINPYGALLPSTWLSLMKSTVLPQVIIEHAPLHLASIEGLMILTVAAIYLTLFVDVCRRGLRVTWLVPLIWFVLALGRVRHGPLFAITAVLAIADMLPYTSLLRRFCVQPGSGTTNFDPRQKKWMLRRFQPALIPCSLVLISFLFQTTGIQCPLIGAGWCKLSSKYWPIEATQALAKCVADGTCDGRVFNDMRFGGYLIYAAPEAQVYIDDRCELYGDSGLSEYVNIRKRPELMTGLAASENIRVAMIGAKSPLTPYFNANPQWQLLHRDATACLYRRISSDR